VLRVVPVVPVGLAARVVQAEPVALGVRVVRVVQAAHRHHPPVQARVQERAPMQGCCYRRRKQRANWH
jgi:hypothetical protein